MSKQPHIFDANLGNFEQEVLLASQSVPILVDFWAPWCGPCKSLMPVLEKVVTGYHGAVRLAKVNTDEQGQLAAMFGVRSLPTVVLFREGQPVDGFMGAQPESAIRELLSRHGIQPQAETPAEPAEGERREPPEQALARIRAALADKPNDELLKLDLIREMIRAGELDAAEREIDQLPAKLGEDSRTRQLRNQLGFARELASAPTMAELERRLAADPGDLKAQHQRGVRLFMEGHHAAAMEQFLEILRRDRQFGDGLAKRALIAAFDLCDDIDLVSRYRRQMASLLF